MIINANNTLYRNISKINFSPEADITSSKVPVNQFVASIITDDDFQVGGRASLYDDDLNVYAEYWLISAVRNGHVVEITGRSVISLLSSIEMDAEMYSGYSVQTAIYDIFQQVESVYSGTIYTLDSSFYTETLTGYVPKQSARDRLQWICMTIGAYIRSFYSFNIEILPVPAASTFIPFEKTFWRPKISERNYVTAIKIKSYSYTAGTPATTDKWVEVNGTYYIQSEQEFVITNNNIPVTVTDNPVTIENVTIINSSNVSGIIQNLSNYYFKNIEVEADVINNHDYEPGKPYIIALDESNFVLGYIESLDFTFGHENRSRIKMLKISDITGVAVTIRRWYDLIWLRDDIYYLPDGYSYSISNPFIDKVLDSHRYIFRPVNKQATGTAAAGLVDSEQYVVALDFTSEELYIISVDDLDDSTSTVVSIA